MRSGDETKRLYDWLVDGAPGASGPVEVVARIASSLLAGGLPVARISAFVRTLHPDIMGRAFIWRPATGVEVREAPYALLQTETFKKSPVARVYSTGVELRQRLDGEGPLESQDLEVLRKEGHTDYLILPLHFTDGQIHAIGYSTMAEGGFDPDALDTLRTISRPLARIAEILALRRTATNLLSAYVGRDAGERILGGQIQRGHSETIRCVIFFSDLRGYTALSADRRPAEILQMLNQVFDCQVPAVQRHGGEVLKFMGDGMLAVFPFDESGQRDAAATCEAALAAAGEAFGALDELNAGRATREQRPLRFGLSLHLGEVAYGNIGGAGRLDFTCIGAAVNLAARIEGLTGKLEKQLLLSERFARAARSKTRVAGSFALKGVEEEQTIYELDPESNRAGQPGDKGPMS